MTTQAPDLDLSPSELSWMERVVAHFTPKLATAAAEPSTETDYADPGYQPDGKQRYPLNSQTRIRAAWSYINMPKNADKYKPDQVARIKNKIKAAGKKIGIQYSEDQKAAGCLHQAFAARAYRASEGENEQIDAANQIRKQLLQLLVMEADEIADEADEDSWDLECLLGAIRQIEQFASNEDMEMWVEELENDSDAVVKAARAQADSSAFSCPSCGTGLKFQRKLKTKLVTAATGEGGDRMNLTDAEMQTIANHVLAGLRADADARNVADTRATPAETGDPKLVLKADERSVEDTRATPPEDADPKLVLRADQRSVEQVRATPGETSDSTMPTNQVPTLSSEADAQVAEAQVTAEAAKEKLPPDPPASKNPTEQEASGTQASENADAYKHNDEHQADKKLSDAKDPARAAMNPEDKTEGSVLGEAEAAFVPFKKKDDNDADDKDTKASASPPANDNDADDKDAKASQQSQASLQRTYKLSNPADLAAYLDMVAANQRQQDVLVGMGNMNLVPTERQQANAAQRATGGQQSVPGEQPHTDGAFDLTKLFSR